VEIVFTRGINRESPGRMKPEMENMVFLNPLGFIREDNLLIKMPFLREIEL
jgi:hypothetical protein